MNDTHATKLPASWVEVGSRQTNGHANGANGHLNGAANGQLNGAANGHLGDVAEPPAWFLEGKAVRTVYGHVPLKYALDWPMMASFDELAGCASWMGGRIPTAEEVQSVYEHATVLNKEEAERKLGKTVPAVNA